MELFSVIPQALGKKDKPTFAGLTLSGTSTPSLIIQSTDASDPTLIFKTTNTPNQLNIFLNESQTEDDLRIEGQTALVDTIVSIRAQDGENATFELKSGAISSFIRMTSSDDLLIKNTAADHDISLQITDGAVQKTITWDADVDKLKHSAGTFDFDNDHLITTGNLTAAGLTITGNSVFGLNSSVFQPTTDSTTFFQVLDADGGTPVLNVDTTNERIGFGTATPGDRFGDILDVRGDVTIEKVGAVVLRLIGTTANQRSILQFIKDNAVQWDFGTTKTTDDNFYIRRTGTLNRFTIATGGNVGIGIESPLDKLHLFGLDIGMKIEGATRTGFQMLDSPTSGWEFFSNLLLDSNYTWTLSELISGGHNTRISILKTSGYIGFGGEIAPETLTEWTSTVPYLTLHNSTHEDTDGGRESRLNFKGEQSGGEETTLARIEISHDGTSDDQKGKVVISTNDGADSNTPTDHFKIDAAGITYIGDLGGTNQTVVEADGTIRFDGAATVFNDLVLPLDSAKVPASNAPSWESFVGNLNAFAYQVNDFQEFTTELIHGYKEGSDLSFHIHGALNALTAQEEKVQFEIEYSIADANVSTGFGDVYPDGSGSLLTAELVVPNATADLTNIFIVVGVDNAGTFGIDATIKGRIRRIAKSAGGNELTGDIFVTQVGVHYEVDTVGSRAINTK